MAQFYWFVIATQSYRKPSLLLFHVLVFVSNQPDCKREMKGKRRKVTTAQNEVGEYLPLHFSCPHRLKKKLKNQISSLSTSEAVAVRLLNYALLLKTNIPYTTLAACCMNSDSFFEEFRQTYTCCNAMGEAACEDRNLSLIFDSG